MEQRNLSDLGESYVEDKMNLKKNPWNRRMLILLCLFLFSSPLYAYDFSQKNDEFVIETKQIKIPGYPKAFNPSIVRWGDKILMSFRVLHNPHNNWHSMIGLVELDENLNIIGKIYFFDTRVNHPDIPSRSEDARLYTVGNKLYVMFNDNLEKNDKDKRRMFIAEVIFQDEKYTLIDQTGFFNYPNKEQFWEKNWVPFDYDGNMLFGYTINPHVVLFPYCNKGKCKTFSVSESNIDWDWGELRGGTPALRIGDEYLAFFHSMKRVRTRESHNQLKFHYVFGAYKFSANPPFNLTAISQRPVSGKDIYHSLRIRDKIVAFPGGIMMDDHFIWISYGKDDCESWVVKLDRKKLLKSLLPLNIK